MELMEKIQNYRLQYPNEKDTVTACIRFIEHNSLEDLYNRKNMQGHITASGMIVKNDEVLVITHPYIQRMLLPGGHVEDGEKPEEAAIREVEEETGYKCVLKRTSIIDIDIHTILENKMKEEGEHLHFDFCYLLEIAGEADNYELNRNFVNKNLITEKRIVRAISKVKK